MSKEYTRNLLGYYDEEYKEEEIEDSRILDKDIKRFEKDERFQEILTYIRDKFPSENIEYIYNLSKVFYVISESEMEDNLVKEKERNIEKIKEIHDDVDEKELESIFQ